MLKSSMTRTGTGNVSPVKTVLVLSAGITAVSFASILIRFADDVPPVMIATYRLIFSSLLLMLIFKKLKIKVASLSGRQWCLSLMSGFFLSIHFVTWITSLKYTSVASSVVLVTMNPIFVGIFSFLLFKEKLHVSLIAGILLSVAGSVVLVVGDSGFKGMFLLNKKAMIGDLLALTGALMASFYYLTGSRARENVNIATYITIVYTISAVMLVLVSLFSGLSFTGYKASSYGYMFLLAALSQLIGHTSFNWALKHLKSSMVAVTTMGEPIGATILAYFLLNESVSLIQGVGMVLIFSAILLASIQGKK